MYKNYIDRMTNAVATQAIIRTTDGACIPFAPDNADYQEYLKWLDEGNVPLPSDSVASGSVDDLTTNQGA